MVESKKLLIAGLLFLVILTFFGPFYGNYCVNDDCAYFRVTKLLYEKLEFSPWLVEAPLFSNYFIGFFSSLFLGFSHTTLRISTMLLSIILFIVSIAFFRKTGLSAEISILSSLLISFNPFVFSLSHSFMADVPGLLFVAISSYFFLSWFDSRKKLDFILALLFSVFAIYTRNAAIFVPLAALAAMLVSKDRKKNMHWIIAIFAFIVLNSVIVLWFNYVFVGFDSHFRAASASSNLSRVFGLPVYFGFSFIGIALLLPEMLREKHLFSAKNIFISGFLVLGALIALLFIPLHPTMPYYGNIMQENGLGFVSIQGEKPFASELFWPVMTIISILSAFVLLSKSISASGIISSIASGSKKNLFLLFSAVFFFAITVFFNYFYDRFIILLLPAALALFLLNCRESCLLKTALLVSVVFFAAFSYYGTSDYFLWRDAAQDSVNSLALEGIPLSGISGNFEFCSSNFPGKLSEGTACRNPEEAAYRLSFSVPAYCSEKNSFEERFFFMKEKVFALKNCSYN